MNCLVPAIPPHPRFATHATLALLVSVAASCSRVTERMEITESREISSYASPPEPSVASEQRFGPVLEAMQMDAPEAPHAGEGAPASGGDQSSIRDLLTWATPQNWKELPKGSDPSGMRLIDMRFGPNGEGECYVSIMPGPAGGLEANLNRWRTQMGMPPYTAEQIAALPKKELFNRDGTYAVFDGAYKAVGAIESSQGYRLAGVIHSAPQATMFVKMIGPKAVVEQNEPAFEQFCKSITPKK